MWILACAIACDEKQINEGLQKLNPAISHELINHSLTLSLLNTVKARPLVMDGDTPARLMFTAAC